MSKYFVLLLTSFTVLINATANAKPQWSRLPDMTSAFLAANGAKLLSSHGLTSGPGKAASVTFWEAGKPGERLYRYMCVSYIGENLLVISERCFVAKK